MLNHITTEVSLNMTSSAFQRTFQHLVTANAHLNRTNNYCESFNKTFADVVGHSNHTIFKFLSAVQLEQASTESKISCYRQGRQPPKRRKIWIEKDASIKRIVVKFHQYENRVLEYLDELAEL